MLTGAERRAQIIHIVQNTTRPVPAKKLAEDFSVSRQVIVQDIALLRASGYDILSTNRGYILLQEEKASRVFKVSHGDDQMEDELCCIVDLGASVINVMVNHRVYGRIEAPLNITSRKDVSQFMDKLKGSSSSPLKNTTSGYHYHTVEAGSEEVLDEVEAALRERGYLVYTGLLRNLTDQVMEQQAKLGYMKEKIRLYYPLSSLRHMLGKDDACDASKMQEILEELADSTAESFGAMRITHQGDRFCFVLSEEISERIHRETPAKAFIHELIGLVGQHETNMEQILELFKAQPGGCIMEHIDSGEFDYVIRFKEGTDRYLYCFKDEGCHITYHRFLPEDYEEFGF